MYMYVQTMFPIDTIFYGQIAFWLASKCCLVSHDSIPGKHWDSGVNSLTDWKPVKLLMWSRCDMINASSSMNVLWFFDEFAMNFLHPAWMYMKV